MKTITTRFSYMVFTDARLAFIRMMHCSCITISAYRHPLLFIFMYIYTLLDAHIQICKMGSFKMGSFKMGSLRWEVLRWEV